MMAAATYGGWFKNQPAPTGASLNVASDQPASTGASRNMTSVVNCVLAATALAVGTGGVIDSHLWQQHPSNSLKPIAFKIPIVEVTPVRTAAENLSKVREVFSPPVSDLASAFGVSRQAIYNWVNGEQPKPEHYAKLQDLAQAADIFVEARIPVTSTLLKRKVFDGKTLFEVAQAGGPIQDAAQLLVSVAKRESEQRNRMNARFAGRSSPRSAESDFPAANDVS